MTNLSVSRFLILLIGLISFTCDDELETRSYPSIDTKEVSNINESGAYLNAEILNPGSNGIIDHGFVYDNFPYPTLELSDRISLGETSAKGIFSSLVNRNLSKDSKYYVRAYAIAKNTGVIVYGQEVEFISMGGSAPILVDFIPKQGSIRDTVLLLGSGFSNVNTENRVSFGSARAEIIKSKEDSIWTIVQSNTPPGENLIMLTVGQFRDSSESKFLLKPIIINSLNPIFNSFGDTIFITGSNFHSQKNLMNIRLLEKELAIISNTTTEIKVIVPDDAVIPKSKLTLLCGIQTIISNEEINLFNPIITSFSPLQGTKDTELIIIGNYFSPIKENNKVEIDGIPLTIIEASKTSLTVKIPSGIPPGDYNLSVTVATQNVVAESNIKILKPSITNVSPSNGTWGQIITLIGENFGAAINDNIIRFDNVEATILSTSSTEIKAIVPNNLLKKSSTISIEVISLDNQTEIYSNPFQLDAPVITSFTPDQGKSNLEITINGQNFNPIPNNQIVKFGDKEGIIINASTNALIVKVPTSIIESDVYIQIDVAEQSTVSSNAFHLISPWKRMSDFPTQKSFSVGFAIGEYGYVTLGNENSIVIRKPCWKFDPILNGWKQVQSFFNSEESHTGSYENQVAFVINENAYVGLGKTGLSNRSNIMTKYSELDNSWYPIARLPDEARESAVAFTILGNGFVTTGRVGIESTSSSMWLYNPENDSWTKKSDLPGSSRWEATGFTIDSDAYLIGGAACKTCQFLGDFWKYDALTDTWIELSNFPGSNRRSSVGFSINGMGYLIGGEISSESDIYGRDVWQYNPTTDSWMKLEDFPGESRADAIVFVINGKAYFGTGRNQSGYLKDFWEFDPSKI